jgi:hypothetical protein
LLAVDVSLALVDVLDVEEDDVGSADFGASPDFAASLDLRA